MRAEAQALVFFGVCLAVVSVLTVISLVSALSGGDIVHNGFVTIVGLVAIVLCWRMVRRSLDATRRSR